MAHEDFIATFKFNCELRPPLNQRGGGKAYDGATVHVRDGNWQNDQENQNSGGNWRNARNNLNSGQNQVNRRDFEHSGRPPNTGGYNSFSIHF